MSAPPVLLAVVPCEALFRDPVSYRISLAGVIGYLPVPGFPYQPPGGIGVYVAVTEVARPVRIAAQLVTPDGSELGLYSWDLPGGDPLFVHESSGRIGAVFGEPGKYSLRVTADGDMLGEWRFDVGIPRARP